MRIFEILKCMSQVIVTLCVSDKTHNIILKFQKFSYKISKKNCDHFGENDNK
jgi:hypothetical protein